MKLTMAPADAAMYWTAQAADNDQFVLFSFDATVPVPVADLVAQVRRRAAAVPDLHLAVESVPADLDYPRWVPAQVGDGAVVVHAEPLDWRGCLDRVAGLIGAQLRDTDALWRVHLFPAVDGAPHASAAARVGVLQISHALGDGRRATAIARALFGGAPVPVSGDRTASTDDRHRAAVRGAAFVGADVLRAVGRGLYAWAAERDAEEPDPEHAGRTPTRLNRAAGGRPVLRTVTVERSALASYGRPVTVAVLTALGEVLPAFVDAPPDEAGAEVTVAFPPPGSARPGEPLARNRFQTVGIGLHASVRDPEWRAELIAAELHRARHRVASPSRVAARYAAAAAPAVLGAVAVRLGRSTPPPVSVPGWTIVSSVARGPADLDLGGGRVLSTAGFPALSAAHGLTHGVHGIGDSITVSLCTGSGFAARIDDYRTALEAALTS